MDLQNCKILQLSVSTLSLVSLVFSNIDVQPRTPGLFPFFDRNDIGEKGIYSTIVSVQKRNKARGTRLIDVKVIRKSQTELNQHLR